MIAPGPSLARRRQYSMVVTPLHLGAKAADIDEVEKFLSEDKERCVLPRHHGVDLFLVAGPCWQARGRQRETRRLESGGRKAMMRTTPRLAGGVGAKSGPKRRGNALTIEPLVSGRGPAQLLTRGDFLRPRQR